MCLDTTGLVCARRAKVIPGRRHGSRTEEGWRVWTTCTSHFQAGQGRTWQIAWERDDSSLLSVAWVVRLRLPASITPTRAVASSTGSSVKSATTTSPVPSSRTWWGEG